jgi:hypothetical protein
MQQVQTNNNSTFSNIFYGLDFLLTHLSKPEFPRTMATKLTEGKQVTVYEKIETLAYYKQANYMDCRLSVYPHTFDKASQIIDFVMLDLDLNNFKYSRQKLDKALNKILMELKNRHGIVPTTIWSGNGYHVLVPLDPLGSTLEDMAEFAKFKEPSKHILRFLEKYISKKKSDSVHNSTVSFGNCMLRVPGSINSKNNNANNKVSIVSKWNEKRFSITPLLGDFHAYLIDQSRKTAHHNNKRYGNLLSRP